ncbi:MAG: DUF4188 domain-containing protein, partial [Candidatus Dormibacteraeota bacterium]|nr:DUF4188 domain-containing protein [Candidatus Dormibacteraeota bacterium]
EQHDLAALLSVDGTVLATTRIRFRDPWSCLRAWLQFRKMYRELREEPDFVRGSLSIVGPSTLMNVSLWKSRRAMLLWSGTRPHVQAVQWTYPRVSEVWSADWSLRHISPSASRWDGPLGDLPTGPQFAKDPRGISAPDQPKLAVASAIRRLGNRSRSTDGV